MQNFILDRNMSNLIIDAVSSDITVQESSRRKLYLYSWAQLVFFNKKITDNGTFLDYIDNNINIEKIIGNNFQREEYNREANLSLSDALLRIEKSSLNAEAKKDILIHILVWLKMNKLHIKDRECEDLIPSADRINTLLTGTVFKKFLASNNEIHKETLKVNSSILQLSQMIRSKKVDEYYLKIIKKESPDLFELLMESRNFVDHKLVENLNGIFKLTSQIQESRSESVRSFVSSADISSTSKVEESRKITVIVLNYICNIFNLRGSFIENTSNDFLCYNIIDNEGKEFIINIKYSLSEPSCWTREITSEFNFSKREFELRIGIPYEMDSLLIVRRISHEVGHVLNSIFFSYYGNVFQNSAMGSHARSEYLPSILELVVDSCEFKEYLFTNGLSFNTPNFNETHETGMVSWLMRLTSTCTNLNYLIDGCSRLLEGQQLSSEEEENFLKSFSNIYPNSVALKRGNEYSGYLLSKIAAIVRVSKCNETTLWEQNLWKRNGMEWLANDLYTVSNLLDQAAVINYLRRPICSERKHYLSIGENIGE